MIQSKKQLKAVIRTERQLYFKPNVIISILRAFIQHEKEYYYWQLQKSIRVQEFWANEKGLFSRIMYAVISRRVYKLRERLGIEIWHSCFDEGLVIYHASGIVVNSNARIGKNCQLHGNNCIGNSGNKEEVPVIGDNCNIGFGASVIGGIKLGNNVTIGAGAVVNKSFPEDNIVLAGVPAQIIKRLNCKEER